MRAIAFLLLGLLAFMAARPACATPAAFVAPAIGHAGQKAHEGCPETRDRPVHHACAMASCLGCSLGDARVAFPATLSIPGPMLLTPGPAVLLAGLGPVAAIPPPRPVA